MTPFPSGTTVYYVDRTFNVYQCTFDSVEGNLYVLKDHIIGAIKTSSENVFATRTAANASAIDRLNRAQKGNTK